MKVTVVGAGNVGATCANVIAHKELANEVYLLDIKEGVAEGKALDIWETSPINLYDSRTIGVTNDYEATAGSEVVVITSGIPRKPGMSRDDLIATNAGIVSSVTENVMRTSPDAKIIIVSNPLDVMTYASYLTAKVDSSRVFGMAGILDTARYRSFLAMELGLSPKDIQAVLMGGHGDTMVPLPRYTTVGGIPVNRVDRQRKTGRHCTTHQNWWRRDREIVGYLGMVCSRCCSSTNGGSHCARSEKNFPGMCLVAGRVWPEGYLPGSACCFG